MFKNKLKIIKTDEFFKNLTKKFWRSKKKDFFYIFFKIFKLGCRLNWEIFYTKNYFSICDKNSGSFRKIKKKFQN